MVKLGIQLPEEFFEEETRCGHLVTKEIKELWAVELDLANELLKVCKKHDIQIFTSSGTTLGAVRHKGFIPWDDDIDFQMTRENYDKLCKVASDEFKYPYFFQTEYTDKGTLRGHAQLRRSDTTGIIPAEFECKYQFNQGIFVDIFPMDNIIEDEKMFFKQTRKMQILKQVYSLIASCSIRFQLNNTSSVLKKILKSVLHIIIAPIEKLTNLSDNLYKEFEKTCAKYNKIDCQYVGCISYQVEKKNFYNVKSFEKVVYMPFECLEMPVPGGYEEQLRSIYGDWKVFVKGTTQHGELFVDTEKPYSEYIKKKK